MVDELGNSGCTQHCSKRKYLTTQEILAAILDSESEINVEVDSYDDYRSIAGDFIDSDGQNVAFTSPSNEEWQFVFISEICIIDYDVAKYKYRYLYCSF